MGRDVSARMLDNRIAYLDLHTRGEGLDAEHDEHAMRTFRYHKRREHQSIYIRKVSIGHQDETFAYWEIACVWCNHRETLAERSSKVT